MSAREFTITELQRAGDGGFVDTKVKFTWTNGGRSAPRGTWKFGVEQRTVRDDYPGSTEPVEQVLGPNFKEFTCEGIWDDRYNEPGFALSQYRAFEALVQRGSMARIEFETITINGIIKGCDFDYKRADFIGYTFTVSPHFRQPGALARTGPSRKRTVDALRPPTEFRDNAAVAVDGMEAGLPNAAAFNALVAGDLHQTVKGRVGTLRTDADTITTAIDQRINPKIDEFTALKRVAAGFVAMKGNAFSLITDLAAAKSSLDMAYGDAVSVLDYDTWTRNLKALARTLALTGHNGNAELSRRVQPKAIAIYYPSKGESLYGISQRFYGTPSRWRLIADRNGLTTLTLQGDEALIIPEGR